MLFMLYIVSALAFTDAMVCFHGICDHLKKPELDCKGGITEKGSVCGCFDVCAKVEGEVCESRPIRGRLPLGKCDKGLVCKDGGSKMMIGTGICTEDNGSKAARSTEQTLCQRRRIQAMISMVVYKGQWFPRCDPEGLYMPQQCDNTGTCFCVDINTGVVDESSKTVGDANCV